MAGSGQKTKGSLGGRAHGRENATAEPDPSALEAKYPCGWFQRGALNVHNALPVVMCQPEDKIHSPLQSTPICRCIPKRVSGALKESRVFEILYLQQTRRSEDFALTGVPSLHESHGRLESPCTHGATIDGAAPSS